MFLKCLILLFVYINYCFGGQIHLGDDCKNWNTGDLGKITYAISCDNIQNWKPDYSITCCPNPNEIIPKPKNITKSLMKCEEYGKKLQHLIPNPQISFGMEAFPGQFPYMAGVGFSNEANGNIQWNCQGSLISEFFVLTSGGCVQSNGKPDIVRLGYCYLTLELTKYDHKIKSFYLHPTEDIGLVEMEEQVYFTKYIKPICLIQPENEHYIHNHQIIASGWSKNQNLYSKNVLLWSTLSLSPEIHCSQRFPNMNPMNHLCAGSYTGQMLCYGTPGGPLSLMGGNGLWVIVGVKESRIGCDVFGQTGVYVRVSSVLQWIEDVVWANFQIDLRSG